MRKKDGSVVLILVRSAGPYKLAQHIWLGLESSRGEKNVSMIHINICKLMEGNSILVLVSIFPRKFLLRVLKINCSSIIPKESEIYE